MIEAWKKRIRDYRARAEELRATAATAPDPAEAEAARHDADMWERMADWEEKNPPTPT